METHLKQQVACNKYQAQQAFEKGFCECIIRHIDRKTYWSPDDEKTRYVRFKRVADTIEAVLGAVYLDAQTRGLEWKKECLKVMKAFNLDVMTATTLSRPEDDFVRGNEELVRANHDLHEYQKLVEGKGLIV